jgi:hypothetical protein
MVDAVPRDVAAPQVRRLSPELIVAGCLIAFVAFVAACVPRLSVALGIASAAINLPIREQPVERALPRAA